MTIKKPDVANENPKLKVVPSTTNPKRSCVVIRPSDEVDFGTIARTAIKTGAFEDCSDDEAGDDYFLVQFPGRPQEWLDYDQINARLREMSRERFRSTME